MSFYHFQLCIALLVLGFFVLSVGTPAGILNGVILLILTSPFVGKWNKRQVLLVCHKNKWSHLWHKLVTCLFLEGGSEDIVIGPKNSFECFLTSLMRGSSHIQSVLIGVEYQNCPRTLDVYLLFAICLCKVNQD